MCVSVSESNSIIDHDLNSNSLRTLLSMKRIYLPSLQTQARLHCPRGKYETNLIKSLFLFSVNNAVNVSYMSIIKHRLKLDSFVLFQFENKEFQIGIKNGIRFHLFAADSIHERCHIKIKNSII